LFPRVRACLAGGAPITPELSKQVRDALGVNGIASSWGLTEFPVATSPRPDADPPTLDHTVGPPVPGVQIRVVGQDGCEPPAGQVGELRVKGPQCFLGYVDTDLDVHAFDPEGWFCSGDLGWIGDDGNVRVTGRLKDVVVRNAENVSALEVENALISHPAVSDVAVIGVPDVRTGERVCAVVVPTSRDAVSLDSLVAHCHSQGLSRHKHPERLELVSELPRNALGKIIKTQLRSMYC
jgi:acyl-CoA synthetase (AMP-forming)/AMP-acid ligase II